MKTIIIDLCIIWLNLTVFLIISEGNQWLFCHSTHQILCTYTHGDTVGRYSIILLTMKQLSINLTILWNMIDEQSSCELNHCLSLNSFHSRVNSIFSFTNQWGRFRVSFSMFRITYSRLLQACRNERHFIFIEDRHVFNMSFLTLTRNISILSTHLDDSLDRKMIKD